MIKRVFIGLALTALISTGCSKSKDAAVDTEYPVIDNGYAEAFPKQCNLFIRGQKTVFKARFSDNAELGSFSIDIHHNFDHHSHSTEVNDCTPEAVKTPVNPFVLIQSFPIAGAQKIVEGTAEITIPANVDAGDYHFMIRLTDKEGWQTIKGISIKIQ